MNSRSTSSCAVNTSRSAPVSDGAAWRIDAAPTIDQTSCCSARPVAAAARLFARRSAGNAACGAGVNASPERECSQRPASTQLTGIFSVAPGATSTETSSVRSCCAPRTSSPS